MPTPSWNPAYCRVQIRICEANIRRAHAEGRCAGELDAAGVRKIREANAQLRTWKARLKGRSS